MAVGVLVGTAILIACSLGLATAARHPAVGAAHPLPPAPLAASLPAAHVRHIASGATSANWGGYVALPASGGNITEGFAQWRVPAVTCPSGLNGATYHLTWVGFDGWTTNTVEQAGTQDYCSGANATPAYYAWWEFYPYNAIQTKHSVKAGDLVQSYVLYNPAVCYGATHCGVYTLDLADLTSGYNFTVVGNPSICGTSPFTGATACEAGNDTSAECITEAESIGSVYQPISRYGNLSFSDCTVTLHGALKGIGGFSHFAVTTVGSVSGKVVQVSSRLSAGYWTRSVFTTTWKGYD
ncbi:MAG TPA: G1 family glutamic endopeptidase [Thermoplasmata archaeon]|nr:G1 family glutamic endopeptidase [Thermoplasmata archaeon]